MRGGVSSVACFLPVHACRCLQCRHGALQCAFAAIRLWAGDVFGTASAQLCYALEKKSKNTLRRNIWLLLHWEQTYLIPWETTGFQI